MASMSQSPPAARRRFRWTTIVTAFADRDAALVRAPYAPLSRDILLPVFPKSLAGLNVFDIGCGVLGG